MTKQKFFETYKEEIKYSKCYFCKEYKYFLLRVGNWEDWGEPACFICEKCFIKLEDANA